MGLGGCAGAERPTGSADAGTELRQSQAPADMANAVQVAALAGATPAPPQSSSGIITLVTPPPSREAVNRAREAMQKQPWHALEAQLPISTSHPVFVSYAEDWPFRQKCKE